MANPNSILTATLTMKDDMADDYAYMRRRHFNGYVPRPDFTDHNMAMRDIEEMLLAEGPNLDTIPLRRHDPSIPHDAQENPTDSDHDVSIAAHMPTDEELPLLQQIVDIMVQQCSDQQRQFYYTVMADIMSPEELDGMTGHAGGRASLG